MSSSSSAAYSDPSVFEAITVSTRELQREFGSGELATSKFHGITISKMGDTKLKGKKHPFYRLQTVAMNPGIPIEDRMRAIRFMDKIPHINRVMGCLEAAKTVIDCEDAPIGERYFFFSNNEKLSKLQGDLAKACHQWFFTTGLVKTHWPLILRLLSASQIYLTELHYLPVWTTAREFIIKLAIDSLETIRIRAEAADILCRGVVHEDMLIGRKVIAELGDFYVQNKMTSIYTNAQSVHNETIEESVMGVIRALLKDKNMKIFQTQKATETVESQVSTDPSGFSSSASTPSGYTEYNSGHIAERLTVLTERMDGTRKGKVFAAFNFILVHPSKYEGVTPADLLVLIWNKIQAQGDELRKELEQRLIQELYDMIATDGACATGIVSRLVNCIQGYIQEEGLMIKMSVKDQLRANIFARLQANLRGLPEADQEQILNEISDDTQNKPTAKEFIASYGVKDELKTEFVDAGLMNQAEFDNIYDRCIADFLGIEHETSESKNEAKK